VINDFSENSDPFCAGLDIPRFYDISNFTMLDRIRPCL